MKPLVLVPCRRAAVALQVLVAAQLALLLPPAPAGAEESGGRTPAATSKRPAPTGRRAVIAWQAALEAKGFSAGLLDGIAGAKTALATSVFQIRRGIPATGKLCARTRKALELDAVAATQRYRVQSSDEAQVSYCPPDWLERSHRARLLYPTLSSMLAEKFHTSERCLGALNPGLDLASLRAGRVIEVPRLRKHARSGSLESLEIDLERKVILLKDPAGRIEGLLHCSVARDTAAVRRSETHVKNIVKDPEYTFDPKKWPGVKNVHRRLVIPPGPRGPVGSWWIGLELSGVGIHGTPEPENIGKTGSHGCFRLANWDAARLASTVSRGTPVRIVSRSRSLDAVLDRAQGRRMQAVTECPD